MSDKYICKFRTKPPWRKNHLPNVTNATLHPVMQALWGHMCIVIFERNPLGKLIWHLALLVELMVGFQNENITWLNTHQCRGNTGISNSTGWRAVWWNFEFHFSNSAISYSIPFHLLLFLREDFISGVKMWCLRWTWAFGWALAVQTSRTWIWFRWLYQSDFNDDHDKLTMMMIVRSK